MNMKKQPHKHAEVIKAWADGAEIEFYSVFHDEWRSIGENPMWSGNLNFRIKPEPKPDFVVCRWVFSDGSTSSWNQSNVRYTFDGETGKLKSAEVL